MWVYIYFILGAILACAFFGWFYYKGEVDDDVFLYIIESILLGIIWPLTVTTALFVTFYRWVDNG